jgi:hypothetical protein
VTSAKFGVMLFLFGYGSSVSRKTPRRRTLRNEPAQAAATQSHDLVDHIDERRQPQRAKKTAERSSEPKLGKEHDASAAVARHRRAIAEDEPPTVAAFFLGHRSEQASSMLIREWNQRQLSCPVNFGDDPRRPTAKSSAAGIEQNRSAEVLDSCL